MKPVQSTADLYRAHFDFVWVNLRRLGVPEAHLEDAAHDVFVVAHRRRRDFDGSCQPRTWLFGILRRVAADHRRRDRRHERRLHTASEQPALRERPEDPFTRREALRRVGDVLLELDAQKREVFILAHMEQMTGREVASALQINPNTAAARLRAARREFALKFGADDSPLDDNWITSVVRTERAPEASRRRVLAALVPIWSADASRPVPATASGGAWSTHLAIAATLLVAGVSGRAAALGRPELGAATTTAAHAKAGVTRHHAPGPQRPAIEDVPAPPPVAVPALAGPREGDDDVPRPPEDPTAADPAPTNAAREAQAPREPARAADDLAEQTRIARAVNATDDPRRILTLTREYQQRYPGGFFSEQLGLRRISALCRLDDPGRARREVRRLRRAFPGSERLPAADADPCEGITSPRRDGHSPR